MSKNGEGLNLNNNSIKVVGNDDNGTTKGINIKTTTTIEEEEGKNNTDFQNNNNNLWNSTSFKRFFRFGTIDSSLLMISLLCGVSLEAVIARRIGVHGYGTVVGAAIGNGVSDTLAALPEGYKASIGAFAGSMVPTFPIFGCLFSKRPLNTRTKYIIGVSSVALLVGSLFIPMRDDEKDD
ncbi:hypothetical protein ABK040_009636 [Willaertia magna]